MDFGNILKRGRKIFNTKDKGGVWGRCEECDERALVYPYNDAEKQVWQLCEECISIMIKDEE